MTLILVDVQPETLRHIAALAQYFPGMDFSEIAGQMLDAQVAYRLEIERMRDGVRKANAQRAMVGD